MACLKLWTDAEIATLRDNAKSMRGDDPRWCELLPGRSARSIRRKARDLGFHMACGGGGGRWKNPWTMRDQVAVYCSYHRLGPSAAAQWSRLLSSERSGGSITRMASRLGCYYGVEPVLTFSEVIGCAKAVSDYQGGGRPMPPSERFVREVAKATQAKLQREVVANG